MSGTSPTPAEQHLGDRLAALVDGELNHDARERVLSHLATCAKCKAEADAQRSVKNVFARAAPPPPSEGFLARLQGLPGGPTGPEGDDGSGPLGGGRRAEGYFGGFGVLSHAPGGPGGPHVSRSDGFGYAPVGSHAPVVPDGPGGGFRIHEVGRPEQDRPGSAWRGRRFAFAAASAVSLAAIALGGTLPLGSTSGARAAGGGTNVVPLRSNSPSPSGSSAEDRRRGGAAAGFLSTMATQPTAPTVPGIRTLNGMPAQNGPVRPLGGAFPAARLDGSSLPPLIRPAVATLPLTTTDLMTGPLAVPPSAPPAAPQHLAAPIAPGLPLVARR